MARKQREVPWMDKRGEVYYAFWYNPETRITEKLSLATTDPGEASRKFAAFLTNGKEIYKPADASGLTVPAVLDAYFFEHIRKNAIDAVTPEISIRHLKAHFQERPVKELGVPDSRGYVEARAAAGVAKSTAARELGVLKAAVRHAVTWKRLPLSDMPPFELPQTPVSKGIWLFEDELRLLREAASALTGELLPQRTRGFIDIAYYTASRRGAVQLLTWSRVNRTARRIKLAYDDRPSKKRRPTVAIDPKLDPALDHLWSHRINDFVLGSDDHIDYWFAAAAELAGLLQLKERDGRPAAKLTPHMLRHSRATHLLQAGKDPWTVAGLLGDSLQTVMRVYGHHWSGHQATLFDDETGSKQATGRQDLLHLLE